MKLDEPVQSSRRCVPFLSDANAAKRWVGEQTQKLYEKIAFGRLWRSTKSNILEIFKSSREFKNQHFKSQLGELMRSHKVDMENKRASVMQRSQS